MADDLISPDGLPRCFGNRPGQDILAHYHDTEWGVPVHDDRHLFEMLTLEGAQAGLSWYVVLRKRAGYKAAFHDFDLRAAINESPEIGIEAALLILNVENGAGIAAGAVDFQPVADDSLILAKRLKLFISHGGNQIHVKVMKGRLVPGTPHSVS